MRLLAVMLLVVAFDAMAEFEGVVPPTDWPALEQRIHVLEDSAVLQMCWGKREPSPGVRPACSIINFHERTCDIYVSDRRWVYREHEMEHCIGKDHVGETTLRDAWERYKATRKGKP